MLSIFSMGSLAPANGYPAAPSTTPTIISASDAGMGYVISVPEAVTITKVRFRYGARTGTPPSYIIALETLDAAGFPSGAILGGGSPASVIFTPPASTAWDNLVQEVTLANSIALTRGQVFAVTIRYSSGTINGSNNSSFSPAWNIRASSPAFPYNTNMLASTWGPSATVPNIGLVNNSGDTIGEVMQSAIIIVYENDLTPDQYGLVWTLANFYSYKVIGVRWSGRSTNALSSTFTLKLYDTNGTTVLQDVTRNCADQGVGSANNGRPWVIYFDDTTLATLLGGSQYRIGLRTASDTGTPVGIARMVFATVADAQGAGGGSGSGTTFGLCTNTDDGAWTDDFTQRPVMELLITDVGSAPSGGGIKLAGRGGLAG